MIRAAISGASGYVGGELLRLLAARPQVAPVCPVGESAPQFHACSGLIVGTVVGQEADW